MGQKVTTDHIDQLTAMMRERGMPEADVLLGHKHMRAESLNYSEAARHYAMAAMKGNPEGMYNLVYTLPLFVFPSLINEGLTMTCVTGIGTPRRTGRQEGFGYCCDLVRKGCSTKHQVSQYSTTKHRCINILFSSHSFLVLL